MAATMSRTPNWRSTPTARSLGLRVHTIANLGAYPSTFWSSVPTYLYAILLSGQYNIPAIYAEVDAVYTNTVSVDAVRGAGRPEATFVVERIVEMAAREIGTRSGRIPPRRTSSPRSRIRRRSSFAYDVGDYAAGAGQGAGACRLQGRRARARRPPPPRASCAASASPPISRPAASRLRRRSARSAAASVIGNRPKCASIRSARSRC